MYQYFIKTTLVAALSAVVLAGCGTKTIKPAERKPVKLAPLASEVSVLSPVFSAKLEQGGSKYRLKNKATGAADLQVAPVTDGLVAASRGGVVTAFSGASAIWNTNVGDVITSGVAAADGLVIVGTRSAKIIALNAQTGDKLWETELPSASLAPALIAHGRAIVSTNHGVSYALDTRSGQTVWQYSTQAPVMSVRGTAKPTLLDAQTALIAAADGRVHAVDIASGLPAWIQRVGLAAGAGDVARLRDVDGAPLVVGDALYATSYSGQLAGFDLKSGRISFVNELASTKSVAALGNQLIGTSIDGEVKAFDRMTGESLWQSDALKFRGLTNPVTVANYVAVGDAQGVIHLFDVTGQIVSRLDTKNPLLSLQVHQNRLYSQSTNGVVNVWQF